MRLNAAPAAGTIRAPLVTEGLSVESSGAVRVSPAGMSAGESEVRLAWHPRAWVIP